jgi:ubiquinone/menaquinone biosynthesis C-methylase UbiE
MSELTEQQARDKNIEEYNHTADKYDHWSNTNLCMQHISYYSTFNELEKEGIEGKTYLEVGCGPCPMGERLAVKGAKKIYALDISSQMIEDARAELTKKGIVDKFELMVADIFDETFELPEKVDVVVLCYTLVTFINNFDMLKRILTRCASHLKPDGFVLLTDVCWSDKQPQSVFKDIGMWCGFSGKGKI